MINKGASKLDKSLNIITAIIISIMIMVSAFSIIYNSYFKENTDWNLLFLENVTDICNINDGDSKYFFNSAWNDSIDKVLKDNGNLSLKLYSKEGIEEDYLRKNVYVFDLPSEILFEFNSNKLTIGSIRFKNQYSDASYYIEDYEKIKAILTKEFGNPYVDEDIFDEHEEYTKEEAAEALISGEIKYCTYWEVDGVECMLYMSKYENSSNILFVLLFGANDNIPINQYGDIIHSEKLLNFEEFGGVRE